MLHKITTSIALTATTVLTLLTSQVIAVNANQTNVLNHLHIGATNPNSDEALILAYLPTLPANEQERLLEQISGEVYTNTGLISEFANRRFIRRLFDPIRSLLYTPSCVKEGEYFDCYETDGLFYAYGDPIQIQQSDLTFWLDIGGGQSLAKHDHQANGFKASQFQISLGGHSTICPFWTLGFGLGYEYDDLHYNVGGNGNSSTLLLGLYSLYRPESYYVLWDLTFGYTWSKARRNMDVDLLHFSNSGKPKVYQGTFYVEGGTNFSCGLANFQPFLGLEIDYYGLDRFSEKGCSFLPLSFKCKDSTNASTRLGLHFAADGPSCLSFNFDIAWQYRFYSTSNNLKAKFKYFDDTFTVHGVSVSRNSFDAEALVAAQLNDNWSLYTEVSGQRWKRAATYSITAGVIAKW